jgi:hypothetical protein
MHHGIRFRYGCQPSGSTIHDATMRREAGMKTRNQPALVVRVDDPPGADQLSMLAVSSPSASAGEPAFHHAALIIQAMAWSSAFSACH